ncbi:oxidoreductase [Mycena latifolia]|nr:oxidoreductase [Mycena latifolia]
MAANPNTQSPWSGYMLSVYLGRKGAQPLGSVAFEEIEAKAKEKLKDYPGAFMYAGGSAGTNSTYHANQRAFEKYRIVPRMLVNATFGTSRFTTIFGVKHSSPIFIAPIGVQCNFTAEAEFAPARAAKALGVPFIMSTMASRSIEDVAEANGDGHRWYQLYWPATNDVALSILSRAKASGFTTLVVTLDTMLLGWRPHDLATSFIPFRDGVGAQVGTSDPAFMARLGREPLVNPRPKFPYDAAEMDRLYAAGDKDVLDAVYLGTQWVKECSPGKCRTWEDLRFLREHWHGPLVLKGIQSVQDAEKCLDYGVDGIIVSNHGGRQIDGTIPSLYALARIMRSPTIKAAQASGKLTVLFDSGIRTGLTSSRRWPSGLRPCLGRPWLYGGIVAGQEGIEQVLRHTMADLDVTLGLSGFASLSEIQGKADEVLVEIDF